MYLQGEIIIMAVVGMVVWFLFRRDNRYSDNEIDHVLKSRKGNCESKRADMLRIRRESELEFTLQIVFYVLFSIGLSVWYYTAHNAYHVECTMTTIARMMSIVSPECISARIMSERAVFFMRIFHSAFVPMLIKAISERQFGLRRQVLENLVASILSAFGQTEDLSRGHHHPPRY